MKCASLAVDGGDFTIPGTTSKVISAMGVGCSSGFEMDTVILTLPMRRWRQAITRWLRNSAVIVHR